jgi:hypothetical protein
MDIAAQRYVKTLLDKGFKLNAYDIINNFGTAWTKTFLPSLDDLYLTGIKDLILLAQDIRSFILIKSICSYGDIVLIDKTQALAKLNLSDLTSPSISRKLSQVMTVLNSIHSKQQFRYVVYSKGYLFFSVQDGEDLLEKLNQKGFKDVRLHDKIFQHII